MNISKPFVLSAPVFFLLCTKGQTGLDSTPVLIPSRVGRLWQTDVSKVKINASASGKAEILKRFGILSDKKVCVLSGGGATNTNAGVESALLSFFYCLSPNSCCSKSFPLRLFEICICCTYSKQPIDCDSCVTI